MQADFYLASRSPRRRDLLDLVGLAYHMLAVDVDETPAAGIAPADYVQATALAKARAGWLAADADLPVLGADTAVILGADILGKPRDAAHARDMLESLSGRWHEVLTAFAIVQGGREWVDFTRTRVLMGSLSAGEIEDYWASGEPEDKAGAYAIQGRGGVFVREIRGSYTGVVGLPLHETLHALRRFGVAVPGLSMPAAERV